MPIATSIRHLEAINRTFMEAVGEPTAEVGPVEQLIARLATLTFRQVEALIALAEHGGRMYAQVAQLVRTVIETWSIAGWVLGTDSNAERLQRAIGLVSYDLTQHRSKLEYQDTNLNVDTAEHWAVLNDRLRQIEELEEEYGSIALPTVKARIEDMGQHAKYAAYRWDSDAVHASTVGLGWLVGQGHDGTTLLGVEATPHDLLPRFVMAWDTASAVYELAAESLGLHLANWDEVRKEAYDEFAMLYASG